MKDYTDVLSDIRKRWQSRMDDDGWVTIKGTHVLLEGGVAVGGGKLKGMTFSNARSHKSGKKVTTVNSKEAFNQAMQAQKAKNPNYNATATKAHESTPESIEDLQRITGASPEQAERMRSAITTFTSAGKHFKSIKEASKGDPEGYEKAQKDGKISYLSYENAREKCEILEDFITRSPKVRHEIRRGTSITQDAYDKMIENIHKGGITQSTGLSSWSTNAKKADNFAQGSYGSRSVVEILKNGTTKGTSIKGLSKFGYEDEVLVSGTQKRRYTGKYWVGDKGITYVEVEEIV